MRIEPRVLKGFRDFLPDHAAKRRKIISKLTGVFESFGFGPIDTPVLEYTDVLLGKGSGETDKQIYRFEDQGGRDVAMRFDLTVPFARYMALHESELPLPFKRYHIDKVWRGENTQRGRYREFTQCDFDIVGTDEPAADFEILLMMHRSFAALGIEKIKIKLNHRGIFNRFLSHIDVEKEAVEIMRTIDKRAKVGEEEIRSSLDELVGPDKSSRIISYIDAEGSFSEKLERIRELAGGEAEDTKRLAEIGEALDELGISSFFVLDPSIMRGLDYYTGIVYETFLDDLPEIGSVCSGGRYDNLASLYTKTRLPGVGSSIGLDRLMAALEELGIDRKEERCADVAIFNLAPGLLAYYNEIAYSLRSEGLRVDLFLEQKKLGAQFKLAERKHIPVALICGEDERKSGAISMKNLRSRESFEFASLAEASKKIRSMI